MPRPRVPRSSKPDPIDPVACEASAIGLLARREHSRFELERKLSARNFGGGVVAETLDKLEASRLLDEGRFIESYIGSRIARGTGPVRIRSELVQRGIASDAAARAVLDWAEDWAALATQVRHKRFGMASPTNFTERARQMRFLQSRGFERNQIAAALDTDSETCVDQ